ncbi:hypothetical protein [Streptomyces nitrosporeus]
MLSLTPHAWSAFVAHTAGN